MRAFIAGTMTAMMFACAAHADENVAYLADVTTYGAGFGDSAGATWGGGMARLDSVTDGAFNPIGQQWNFDSVFDRRVPGIRRLGSRRRAGRAAGHAG